MRGFVWLEGRSRRAPHAMLAHATLAFFIATIALGVAISALATPQAASSHASRVAPPVADAGPDVATHVFQAVTIDGSNSHDPAADAGVAGQGLIAFHWTIARAPAGSVAQIDAASPAPLFVPDRAGEYVLQLTVTGVDGSVSAPTPMTLRAYAGDAAPVALTDAPRAIAVGTVAEVDAGRSFDPDGNALAFAWSFASLPSGSRLTDLDLLGADRALAQFMPDVEGSYVLALRVDDGAFVTEARMHVDARAGVLPPLADPRASVAGDDILLDGSASRDANAVPLPLGFSWHLVARPAGSASTRADIRDADAAQARFTPDAAGTYVFRLQTWNGREYDARNVLVRFAAASAGGARASAATTNVASDASGNESAKAQASAQRGVARLALNVHPRSLRVIAGEEGAVAVKLVGGQAAQGDPGDAARNAPATKPKSRGAALEATLAVQGLPAGASARFADAVLTPGDATTLTVATAATTPAGVYTLHVTAAPRGVDVALVRAATMALRVGARLLGAPPVACSGADVSKLARSVYVSPTGADSAACGATPATACATIQRGIDVCSGAGCGVLVRYGRYTTSATIDLKNGVSVYGSCTFSPEGNPHDRTLIDAHPAPGTPAISAVAITSATTVSGIAVIGKDETASGAASIAMIANASPALALQDTMLAAGRGGDGATGATDPAASGGSGQQGQGSSGGAGGPSCPANPSSSGKGGNGGDVLQYTLDFPYFCFITCPCGYPNADSSAGRSGQASGSIPGAGGGGRSYGGNYCTGPAGGGDFTGKGGGTGSLGTCATQGGVPSANLFGQPNATTGAWLPASGGQGGSGSVGSGGGGGSGGGYCVGFPDGLHPQSVTGNPGSGGGGGGCGGNGGEGGQQGGASLALVLVNSNFPGVPVQNSLVPGPGGRGGDGGVGGQGGPGGGGASGLPAGPTSVGSYRCPGASGGGGAGGQGGAGGGGSGGNGGPSVGILLLGTVTNPGTAGIYAGLPGLPGGKGAGGRNPTEPGSTPCTGAVGTNGTLGGFGLVVDPTRPAANFLLSSDKLTTSQKRLSANGTIELVLQTDGNFCIYKSGVYQWCSLQAGFGTADAVTMQTDGNLCLATNGVTTKCTNTAGHPGAYLVVQDDAHAVIYDGATVLWTAP